MPQVIKSVNSFWRKNTVLTEIIFLGIKLNMENETEKPLPSADQVRAARGLLDWSAAELAARARVSIRSIQRFEAGHGAALLPVIREAILAAIEREGIEFADGGVKPRAMK